MNKYLLVSKRGNIKEYINCNFDNCLFIHTIPYNFEINKIIKEVRNNNYEQVILEDYAIGLDKIISKLSIENIKIKLIWTGGLATLNSDIELGNLLEVIELLKNKKIYSIAFTDDGMYEMYKSIKGVYKIKYTVNSKKENDLEPLNRIGVYGEDIDWRSNYFNQIASVKMVDGYKLSLIHARRITNKYCKLFNIKYVNIKSKLSTNSFRKSIMNNDVNSMVEFSNRMDLFIIDSFNYGVPCVIGNNTLFFANTDLEQYVVVKSDDDINEISEKMMLCIKNKKKIISVYNKIKKQYDKESKTLINSFIER